MRDIEETIATIILGAIVASMAILAVMWVAHDMAQIKGGI